MAKRARKSSKVSIEFTRDALPKEGGGFVAGQQVELDAASAHRWIRRNAAMLCEIQAKSAPTEKDEADE